MEFTIASGNMMKYFDEFEMIVVPYHTNILPCFLLPVDSYTKQINKIIGEEYLNRIKNKSKLNLGDVTNFRINTGDNEHKNITFVSVRNMFGISSEKSIVCSVKNILELAEKQEIKSIVMPLLGYTSRIDEDKRLSAIQDVCAEFMESDISILILRDT